MTDSQHLKSENGVILALGGFRSVAELCGVTPEAVMNWRRERGFPADTFVLLTKELAKRGYRAPEKLWKMRTKSTI
jgi:hypothetical protein